MRRVSLAKETFSPASTSRNWRTCSSAVANEVIVLVLSVLVLVFGAGAEVLLPKALGVGFPVLMTAVQFSAARRSAVPAALFAIAAGALEDALAVLPPMTSVSYFLGLAALIRWSGMPRAVALFTYPAYQVWLFVWTSGLGGGVFGRVLLALPVGLFTAVAVGAVLGWMEGRAAVNEQG